MSILIKDMEMPETCDECEFHCYHSYGEYVCVAAPLLYPFNLANSKGIRKDWCPLVEVPEPHGDLIDRDAFKADFSMGENCDKCGIELKRCEYDRIYTKMDFCGWLDDAPTIIAREDGENHDD